MSKSILLALGLSLTIATTAQAQIGGGGGGHGGRGGGGGRSQQSQPAPSSGKSAPAVDPNATPLDEVEIIGVIRAIDAANDRVTIDYQAVEALNWPAGSMPFVVEKPALLDGVKVGEKVRFHLQSQQISALRPF